MIRLTRLNHVPLLLNSDLIEHVEITPDTVITLTTGHKIMVIESAEDIVDRVIQFRRAIIQGSSSCNWMSAHPPAPSAPPEEEGFEVRSNPHD
jgi:flagellar protein FlbD